MSTPPDPDPDPTDDPGDDAGSGGGCNGFWSGIFGNNEVRPFPFLQFLIDLLTQLLDRLNEIQTEADNSEAAVTVATTSTNESANTPLTTSQPATLQQTVSQPSVSQPAVSPLASEPFVLDEQPIAQLSGKVKPVAATGVGQSRVVVPLPTGIRRTADELPPSGATKLEIRRWILNHPGSRSKLKHLL